MIELGKKVRFEYDNNYYAGIVIIINHALTNCIVSSLDPILNNPVFEACQLGDHVDKSWCGNHFECVDNISDYHHKWHGWFQMGDLEVVEPQVFSPRTDTIDGCNCKTCGQFTFMAAANQSDGTFKCYSCRNNPIRTYY